MTKEEFEDLLHTLRPRLLRSALHRWGEEGEDILQEALLRTWKNISAYDHSTNIFTWIFAHAVIIASDNARFQPQVEYTDDVFDIESDAPSQEDIMLIKEVGEVIDGMSAGYRQALLDYMEGKPVEKREVVRLAKQKLKEKFK